MSRKIPIEVLDGALGTALVDHHSLDASSTALWGGSYIKNSPSTLKSVHKSYIESGADIIETATYQCAFETFKRDDIDEYEATNLFRNSVKLVDEVRSMANRKIKCALSLGPYGAICTPGQEYKGIYPEPYSYDPKNPAKTIFELKQWHKKRLSIFVEHEETWAMVDIVAFETIPRGDEVEAITEYMAELEQSGKMKGKEWWIALVFPDGKRPDGQNVEEVVKNCFKYSSSHGLGINCTKPSDLLTLVDTYSTTVQSLELEKAPTLVLYPDGGLVYDSVKQEWLSFTSDTATPIDETTWAQTLMKIANTAIDTGIWRKVVVGGCCKAGITNIKVLRNLVDQYSADGDRRMLS